MSDKIKEIRDMIDRIDESLLDLLNSRKKLVQEIGRVKRDMNLSVLDKGREDELIDGLRKKAEDKGLDAGLIDKIYGLILKNSKKIQQNEKN